MTDKKVYLGIDIGGTKIKIGVVDDRGRLAAVEKYPTRWGTYAAFQADMRTYLRDFLDKHEVIHPEGVGIGFRAEVNHREQQVTFSRIINDAVDFDICGMAAEFFNCPIRLDNDVNAMASGEYLYGAGRGRDSFVYVNIGTGLGCGIVSDGRMIRGRRGNAGELCQYFLREGRGYASLENCISGESFSKQAQRLRKERKITAESAGALFDAWEGGDPEACAIVERGVRELALGIVNMEAILDSGLYVFGGKVASNGRLVERIREEVFAIAREIGITVSAEFCISQLGAENSGVIGAAALVKYELEEGRNGQQRNQQTESEP